MRKDWRSFFNFKGMRFGKLRMFLYLNGFTLLLLGVYLGFWLTGGKAEGRIISTSLNATVMQVTYAVGAEQYTGTFMRNGLPLAVRTVPVRYLTFQPTTARVNSFIGIAGEPFAWWGYFFLASAILLLTNNTVFTKGTVFQLHGKFPWISMEEYFPGGGIGAPQRAEEISPERGLPDGWRKG